MEPLLRSMNSIPEGKGRDDALKRIERLDCGNPDKTLASCDPAAMPPLEVLDWQKTLKAAGVDNTAYIKALAAKLRGLVCATDANAIRILRGVMRGEIPDLSSEWLAKAILSRSFKFAVEISHETTALVDFIMSKDCPVSALLTSEDIAELRKIKQPRIYYSLPPSSKKEK